MNAQAVNMEFLPHLRNQSMLYHAQYYIQNLLGYGLSSWSYLAVDRNLDLPVVIKEYFPHGHCQRIAASGKVTLYDPDKRELFSSGSERFAEDARRLALFNHCPGSVNVYNLFRENGTVYLVMEYQPGSSLEAWLHGPAARPSWTEAVQELATVLEALHAMHLKGVTRGDLHPEVLHRCNDGRIMMLEMSPPHPEKYQHKPLLSPVLIPGYAAFEQYTSPASVGPWSDVHGAAAVLFWMVSGLVLPGAMERAVHDPVIRLIENCREVPDNAREILTRALAFRMRERCQSCQELLDGLMLTLASPPAFLEPELVLQPHSIQVTVATAPEAASAGIPAATELEADVENEFIDDVIMEIPGKSGPDEAYTGSLRFGWKHGQGSQVYKNGDRYAGEWTLGRRHGLGTYIYANGDHYQGQWKWDRRHGQGTLVLASGKKYIGEWKDDLQNGPGKEILPNGERYIGQWKDGKRSGQGTEIFSNGDRYMGEWLYGLRNGQGTEIFANGDKYTGEWRADKRNGQGKEFMANGEIFEGEFKDGRRHGSGTLKMPNGDEIEDEWRLGRRREREPIFQSSIGYGDSWSRRRPAMQ